MLELSNLFLFIDDHIGIGDLFFNTRKTATITKPKNLQTVHDYKTEIYRSIF
jgi:hypothetical protein